ncbi:MAG: Mrp/NBP35 family ATP-binding protein [Armatimonadetes bacterium]|nr:Mrp/NBP35 family ATP-binding protein [Armatimonadota bacterium]
MPVSQDQVLEALKAVEDPDLHRDIVALGFVKDVEIEGDSVSFKVELTTPACPVKELLQQQCHEAVIALEGVASVAVEMTARVWPSSPDRADRIPEVKQCIAIASGKGGVGKSTVAVNLAVALAEQGAKVGLLDADVYGPSIPMMMGTEGEKPLAQDSKIVPIERYGIRMMSMGFLLEEGQAVMWRGPMVAATVKQLLDDVIWGELDYLLVDLPPGTGDAPMSLAQLVPLTGVVIVTTPHSVAANIAGKAAQLFQKLEAPLLGVVENMGQFVCPSCHEEFRLFNGTRGDELAKRLGIPYLGSIPLDPAISQSSDDGRPAIMEHPDTPQAAAFRSVAGRLAAEASILTVKKTEEATA